MIKRLVIFTELPGTDPISLSMVGGVLKAKRAKGSFRTLFSSSAARIVPGLGSQQESCVFLFGPSLEFEKNTNAVQCNLVLKGYDRVKLARAAVVDEGKTLVVVFTDIKQAKVFVDINLFGELYLMDVGGEANSVACSFLSREVFLRKGSQLDVGFFAFFSSKLFELKVFPEALKIEPLTVTEKKVNVVSGTDGIERLCVKKWRVSLNKGLNLLFLERQGKCVYDGDGKVVWEIHDDFWKVYVL